MTCACNTSRLLCIGIEEQEAHISSGLRRLCIEVQVETNEVCIPDFDYDTISWMLRYMYGCLELTPQHLSHTRVLQPSVNTHVALLSCWLWSLELSLHKHFPVSICIAAWGCLQYLHGVSSFISPSLSVHYGCEVVADCYECH